MSDDFSRDMSAKLKICMLAAEVEPYAKAGGLADVVAALTDALISIGVEVSVFTPLYRQIRSYGEVSRITDLDDIWMAGRPYKAALYADTRGVPPRNWFIENNRFFDRDGIYTEPTTGEGYEDNFERYNFFTLAVLQSFRTLGWKPDVVHCHDSQAALAPAYLKLRKSGPFYERISTVLTMHNLAYQGIFDAQKFKLTGLPQELFYPLGPFEYFGQINMMKAGILYADVLNTVSPQYAREIQGGEEYGCGLESVLRLRKDDLYGILNGIDVEEWDPGTDRLIFANFSADDLSGKKINKEKLQRSCGLPVRNVPLIGMISRLADQKGLDLLVEIQDDLRQLDCQWIVLGMGLKKYHDWLERLQKKNPGKFFARLGFDNQLAHRIEAGTDFFLMPSRYEPCGLNQMYSMRYGAIPVVRHTGGLADTVQEFDPQRGSGNGFKFYEYDSQELLKTIARALEVWRNKDQMHTLIRNAMAGDFSWDKGARQYADLYQKAIARG